MKKLCLVEYDYQAADLLKRAELKEATWVALGPLAMHYLSQKNIPYAIPEDYCSREEIETACVSQFEQLTSLCQELDAALLESQSFLKEWGIRPFFSYLWELGEITDNLLSRTVQLKKLLGHYPEHEIYLHLASPQQLDFSIGFSRQETLWGRLLALPGWGVKVHFLPEPIKDDNEVNAKLTGWHKWSRYLFLGSARGNILLNTILQSLRKGYLRNIVRALLYPKIGKKNGVAMLNGLYEWESIIPSLIDSKYPVFFISGPALLRNGSFPASKQIEFKIWEPIIAKFKAICYWPPINYTPIIQERLAFIADKTKALAKEEINKLERFFVKRRLRTLLTSVGRDLGSYVVKQYCRTKDIRVFCWQHGAAWVEQRASQRFDIINLVGIDTLLVYGDAVRDGYASLPLAREEKCKIISVGMPSLKSLENITPANSRENLRILWPFGGYYSNDWYCGFSPPPTDRIYYEEQMIILRNILELLDNYTEAFCTIKLCPGSSNDPPWITELANRKGIKIIRERPNFVELLSQHDLVIIDSPTTTLLQSVATRLPVFVLMSIIRWPDKALELLRRRAYCAESAAALMKELNRYLKDGGSRVDENNRDFIKYYGSHQGDGPDLVLEKMREFWGDLGDNDNKENLS